MIVNEPTVLAEVTDMFRRYEAALLANDIDTLDAFFWPSPLALRYGVGERLYGYEAIAAFRKARPGGSPQRTLGRTEIVTFGMDFATANTEFHRADEHRIGRQSQVWAKFGGVWMVVSAHISLESGSPERGISGRCPYVAQVAGCCTVFAHYRDSDCRQYRQERLPII